jgi:hypothetical protein
MKRFSTVLFVLVSGLVMTACGAGPSAIATRPISTEVSATPTETSTPTASATPTETPTVTPERLPVEDRWQVSPDGHIAYNEAQLYGGLFTIDTEHPEYTGKYWEDSVRGLWNLNSVGKNTAFLSQFPTPDSLVKYLQDGGGPVNNLWIPVIYPKPGRGFYFRAALEPIEGSVDLSQIVISIYKPTIDEIYHYSPSYATGTKFISYTGAKGEVLVEKVDINGRNILKFTLRRDLLTDATNVMFRDGTERTFLAMTDEKTSEENLLAATQLIRSWLVQMQTRDEPDTGIRAWIDESDPPRLNFLPIGASVQVLNNITTLDGTPLKIR